MMVIIRQKADDALGHKERKQRKTNIRNEKKKRTTLSVRTWRPSGEVSMTHRSYSQCSSHYQGGA